MISIIIPIHPRGGKFKNNTELRYALRSIERHFKEEHEVLLACKVMPEGFSGCQHLYDGGKGLKTALIKTAEARPEGFFWWYDDCVLLLPQIASDLKQTLACKGWSKAQTKWSNQLTKIKDRLEAEGFTAWDYSRPHGPYWFDKRMVDEGFADWPGMQDKFPWESWILSKRDWPRRHGNYKQYYGSFNRPPGPNEVLLNYCDGGFTPELQAYLEEVYPKVSSFESAAPRMQVHTIRFGNPWWLRLCAPTLDAWCSRHKHPLKVWSTENISAEYPEPKYCEIDMLREFVASEDDWMVYVDADVYVDASAPAHPTLSSGFWMREDLPGGGPRDFRRWLRRHRKSAEGWIYRNAGVWMCDKTSATKLLETITPPYLPGCMEQHQWNWWLSEAARNGLRVGILPPSWNAWAYESKKGAFYHIAGKRKVARLAMFRANGRIPYGEQPAEFTKSFNFEPYRFTLCGSTAPMDEMHIHMLREALRKSKPNHVAVEIGSWRGASTSAFIDAINCGELGHLHIIETRPKPELYQVIALCQKPECITLHTNPSWDLESPIRKADFVFIDGDHKWAALADTLQAMAWGAETICIHDTHAWPEVPDCWGAHTAANILRRAVGRSFVEDKEDRPSTLTRRGLLISTRDD